MRDHSQNAMDLHLGLIFQQGIEQPYDDAFRIAVRRKIGRPSKIRKAVLATAIAAGGLIALFPAYQLTLALGDGIAQLSSLWNGVDWSQQHLVLSVVTVVALVAPLLTIALEE